VDLVHVRLHDAALGADLEARPAELLPLVRATRGAGAAAHAARQGAGRKGEGPRSR
jgi:hypothetical protein